MPFTITSDLERVPDYAALCRLAGQHHVHITGTESAGSFSSGSVAGQYEFGASGLSGEFNGHGVAGQFCFEPGRGVVTIAEKPFWLPEVLLRQKIVEGLESLRAVLASGGSGWRMD